MIACLKNNEIDPVRWDQCVGRTPGVKPYGYSWYLDIMAPGWEALVEDDYRAVFPIPASRKYGFDYISTPVFTQRLGIFSPEAVSPAKTEEFLDKIPGRFRLVDLCIAGEASAGKFSVIPRVNYELDLTPDYNLLYKNFSHHCRRNIEASAREKNDLTDQIDAAELVELFRKNRGSSIRELNDIHYNRLVQLINYCIRNNKGRITGARDRGGRLIYGIFLLETDGNIIMLLVVNTPESRERRIGYSSVNELIKQYSGTNTILDFEGSSIPSVASFMESFGSWNIPYSRLYRNNLPWIVKGIKALRH